MSPQEVAIVLAKVKLYDNREVTSEVLRLWSDVFAPVRANAEEAVEALHIHMRESGAYTLPVHIITNIRRLHEERHQGRALEEQARPDTFVSDPKPDNFDEMAAAWDDPVRFGLEVAKYRKQVAAYHRARRAA